VSRFGESIRQDSKNQGNMMKPNPTAPFKLHVRHLAILSIFFSIFLGILIPITRDLGSRGVVNPPLVLLILAPWLLAILILAFERKSPVKFWLAPFLLSLLSPALAISHNWLVLESWLRHQTMPNLLVTLTVNIVLMGTFTFFAAELSPRRCPDCKRLAMIPLRNFWGPGARTPNTRWCAACGAKYWRTCDGEWREERRLTWFDNVKESRKAAAVATPHSERAFKPETRPIAPMLSDSRIRALASPREREEAGVTEGASERINGTTGIPLGQFE
jgi:hypothetical protein